MHSATFGDRVRVQCTRLSQSPPATARPAKVLEFIVGSHSVVPGLSQGVVGMTQGDHKCLRLEPAQAFGPVRDRLIREIPRSRLPPHLVLSVGKRLTARGKSIKSRRAVRVVQIKSDSIVVDGNHRLAGKVLTLEITLLSVDSSSNANKSKQQFDGGGES